MKSVERENGDSVKHQPYGVYEAYLKRPLDFTLALLVLPFLFPIYLIVAILVRVKLGKPIIFTQKRPGKDGKLFKLYKFRTMTDERNENGELLSDEERLTEFGKWLRSTSLDELPEIWLILIGKMSVLGPRPLLVKDMVFMSKEHNRRHDVRPGLSGLAQVMGRNNIDWEEKLNLDIQYVNHITFREDVKLLFLTTVKVLRKEGITENGMCTAADYGDYLLEKGCVTEKEYVSKQKEAKRLLES